MRPLSISRSCLRFIRVAGLPVAMSVVSIGCGPSANSNIADDASEDAKAEYKRMIAEQEAAMGAQPPENAE